MRRRTSRSSFTVLVVVMNSVFWGKLNSRIALKLALWVIIFSSIITLMATAVQLYFDYRQDITSIEEYFNSITSMQLISLSQNVWIMDDRQINAHLEGIIKGRDIAYAAVMVNTIPHWQRGQYKGKNSKSFNYQLFYSHKDKQVDIGTLKIVANLDSVHSRLFKRAILILLTNALKTFLFAATIFLLFQFSVTRHLEKLASHVVNMDFRKKLQPLKLGRDSSRTEDEFSQVVSFLNVMQRRGFHAFRAMEKSEQRLRLFFDSTEEGIFGIDLEQRFTFSNKACQKMIGVKSGHDIIGRKVRDVLQYIETGSVADNNSTIFQRSMEIGESVSLDDVYLKIKDGYDFYASVGSYPIIADGKCTGAIVFFNDIGEQRELLKEKNMLRQAVRQSPLSIFITDETGNIEYVNPGFEKSTGFLFKDVVGKKPYVLGRYTENRQAFKGIRTTLSSGEKWQGHFSLIRKNGIKTFFDIIVSPVLTSDGKIANLIAVCLDITQRIELQNQLNRAQKMEAVGRLSSSFAHEFGNPLLGVRSVIKDISERVVMEDEDRHLLDLAYAECDRMKVLIRDFQQFQGSGPVEKELNDIHTILDNVLFFYRKQLESHSIKLDKQLDPHIPMLYLSKYQITQVFLNLIINGVDSMTQKGGILTVATLADEDYVIVNISDTGGGIMEKDRELIFEPFYTTKLEVEGTGLGLAISYGIISSHGGDITVSSTIDVGSTFTVKLPRNRRKN